MASDAPVCDVDGAHVPLRAGALQQSQRGQAVSKTRKSGWIIKVPSKMAPPPPILEGILEPRARYGRINKPRAQKARILELDRVFSLCASKMSSETATLNPLRWILELNSQELSLRCPLSCYSVPSDSRKKLDEALLSDNLRLTLITTVPITVTGPPSDEWANCRQSKAVHREPSL